MANRHCAVKNGRTGSAAKHYAYIVGQDKYAEKGREEVILRSSGNMPEFAQENPSEFWKAADQFERKSHTARTKANRETGEQFEKLIHGRAYKEVEFSIPREITDQAKQIEFAQAFAAQLVGKQHPYTLAVHHATAKDGLPNVNAHLMFSERINDGVKRDAELFFKRQASAYRDRKTKELIPADPEKGGAGKNREMNTRAWVQGVRQGFQEHARRYGVEIDMRSNKEQGLGDPEPKLGPAHPRAEHVPYREHKIEVVDGMREARAEAEVERQNQERIARRSQEQRGAKEKELERRKGALEKLAERIQSGEVSIRTVGSEIDSIGFVRRYDDPNKWVVEPALHEAFDAVLDTARKAVAESKAKRMAAEAERQAEAKAREAEKNEAIRWLRTGADWRKAGGFDERILQLRREAAPPSGAEIVAAREAQYDQYDKASDPRVKGWLDLAAKHGGFHQAMDFHREEIEARTSGLRKFWPPNKRNVADLKHNLRGLRAVMEDRDASAEKAVQKLYDQRRDAAAKLEKAEPYIGEADRYFRQDHERHKQAAIEEQKRAEAAMGRKHEVSKEQGPEIDTSHPKQIEKPDPVAEVEPQQEWQEERPPAEEPESDLGDDWGMG